MIRRYGPGKFTTILDSYVYELAMDGADDSLGDVESFNYYSTLRSLKGSLPDLEELAARDDAPLTREEVQLVRQSYGAIIEENNQGFVYVGYYRTKAEFEVDWKGIEDAWADLDDEDEE